MSPDPTRQLARRLLLGMAAAAPLGAGVAWVMGAGPAALGYLGGLALGALSVGGVFWSAGRLRTQPPRRGLRRLLDAWPAAAKFPVVLGGLWVMVASRQVDSRALAVGLGVPVFLMLVLALVLPRTAGRQQP